MSLILDFFNVKGKLNEYYILRQLEDRFITEVTKQLVKKIKA